MSLISIRKPAFNQKFLWLLLANIAFFIIAATLLPIRFEENDDSMMLLISSGKYSGAPDAHLIFINYIYGLLLKFLYDLSDGLEWYSILFAVINILSITIISWSIIIQGKIKPFYKILFLFIFYLLEIRFIELFQFTTIAAMCALAGIILILRDRNNQCIAGVFFFVLASLIRFDAAFLVLLITCPLFIHSVIVNKRFTFGNPLRFLTAALVLALAFKFIDYKIYQNDTEWKYYVDYNTVRGQINDNPNADQLRKDLPIDISTSDFDLFLGFKQDGYKMNLYNLQLLQSELKKILLKDKISHIPGSLWIFKFSLIGLIVAGIGVIYRNPKRMNQFIMGMTLIIFLLTLAYISLDATPKSRAFLSAVLPFLYVIYCATEGKKSMKNNLPFLAGIGFFTLLFLKQNIFTYISAKDLRATQFSQQKELVKQYLTNPKNSVVLAPGFRIEYYPVFSFSSSFQMHQIFFMGWATNIPFNKGYFDSFRDLVNRHAIFLYKKDYPWISKTLVENIKQNYRIYVIPQAQMESKDYLIVKFISKDK